MEALLALIPVVLPVLVYLLQKLLGASESTTKSTPLPTPKATPKRAPTSTAAPPRATPAAVPQGLQTMALTVWAEARGEPKLGQIAVAHVILNRARSPGWWGTDIQSVCLQPYQFSCWLKSDPQSKRLADPKTRELPSYLAIEVLCLEVLAGKHPDPTGGCDHYCTQEVAPRTRWAKGRTPAVVIGNHNFYKLGKG